MLRCPISGMKMTQAFGNGGKFWYCKHSRSRAITLEMAKKFLGSESTTELWVRSELKYSPSENNCPSCFRPMRTVGQPSWMGGGKIDICRTCHFFWIKPGEHLSVPHPEDLLDPLGDGTLIKDRGEGLKNYLTDSATVEFEKNSYITQLPENLSQRVLGFLGIPVEEDSPLATRIGLIGGFIILICVVLHLFFIRTDPTFIIQYGFYPGKPMLNYGLNAVSSCFIHGGWLHLFFNLYFFYIFSDDVEADLGFFKFFIFVIFAAITSHGLSVWFQTDPSVPHVGLSGVVMAMMAYYTLSFPHSRIGFIFPGWILLRNKFSGNLWWRFPAWSVFCYYLIFDMISFWFVELREKSTISHSGHVSGVIAGILFWILFSKPKAVQRKLAETVLENDAKRIKLINKI